MRLATLLIALVVLAGCGGDDGEDTGEGPAGARVDLQFRVDDGRGDVQTASLRCAGGQAQAGGYLEDGDAAELCRSALALRGLLTEGPPEDRVCTQIFGGPQTARVTGSLAGEPVDRRFSRRNGCRIAEWDRLSRAGLLPPA